MYYTWIVSGAHSDLYSVSPATPLTSVQDSFQDPELHLVAKTLEPEHVNNISLFLMILTF